MYEFLSVGCATTISWVRPQIAWKGNSAKTEMSIAVLSLRLVKVAVLCLAKRPEEAAASCTRRMRMSKEDDFFGDFNDSPDDVDTGQEDTSEPLMEDEPAETEPAPASE